MAAEKNDASPVHLPQPAGGEELSKTQQEFNRLSARIAELEQEVRAFEAAATQLRQQVQQQYRPLQARHNEQRAALVLALNQAFDTQPLTRAERRKIADLIARGCTDLPRKGFPELQPIIDRYAPPPTAAEQAAADHAALEALKQQLAARYGLDFDPAADLSTPAKLRAYLAQHLAAGQAARAEQQYQRRARRAKRQQRPRPQAAAAAKPAEAAPATQSVRTLYLDLVKHLHPDREPDQAERVRKTELLQQVTAAYEANELLTLLRLQLELQRPPTGRLRSLAESQLRYFNQLLRAQAHELGQRLLAEQQALAAFTSQPVRQVLTPAAMRHAYERQQAQLVAKTEQLATEVQAFNHDFNALKAFLREYEIPKDAPN